MNSGLRLIRFRISQDFSEDEKSAWVLKPCSFVRSVSSSRGDIFMATSPLMVFMNSKSVLMNSFLIRGAK